MEHTKNCVLLISGGLDSVTLLHYLVKEESYKNVYGLSFLYGQKHSREIECAKWQMNSLSMKHHHILDLSVMAPLLKDGSALILGGKDVPQLKDIPVVERGQPPTYVPNRNMIFLAIGSAWAESLGVTDVFYSAQAQDEYGYWDCTESFVTKINQVFALNRKHCITIHAPFLKKSKKEILALGFQLGVDYAHTWSCYGGEETACGICPTCIERLNAFKAVGEKDPIPYLHEK
ncbi:MAG: 7-cyano-7-deazaguanine synthase QueC [Candidatus Hydrogenedens sp.]